MHHWRIAFILCPFTVYMAGCIEGDDLSVDQTQSVVVEDAPAPSIDQVLSSSTSDETGAASAMVTDGNLVGTKVDAPSGSLPVGSTLAIGTPLAPGSFSQVEGLVAYNDPISVSLSDSAGEAIHTVSEPLTIAINLPSEGSALHLAGKAVTYESLCILLDASDGKHYVWTRDKVKFASEAKQIQFQSLKVGTFQLADCGQAVLGSLYENAADAGIAGRLQLLLSMTVEPTDFGDVKAGSHFCLYTTDAKLNPIDGFSIPLPAKAFTAHIVSEPQLYSSEGEYKVFAKFSQTACIFTKEALDSTLDKSPPLGPFAINGKQIASQPATGVLGDKGGAFALTKISFSLKDYGLLSHQVSGCLVRLDANDKVKDYAPLAIGDGKLNDSKKPFVFWTTAPHDQTIITEFHAKTTCGAIRKGERGSDRTIFPEASAAAVLSINVLPLELYYYQDLVNVVAAAPGDPDKPVCLAAYGTAFGTDQLLGRWRFFAKAPKIAVLTGEDPIPEQAVVYLGGETPTTVYDLVVTTGAACTDDTDTEQFTVPATGDDFTAIDFE